MQEVSHATAMLKMVTQGDAMLDLSPADDVSIFMEVFDEFVKTEEFYLLPEHRQQYIMDLLKRQFAPVEESRPESTEDAVEQLGMVQSPAMKAQIAAGAIDAASQQAEIDAIGNNAAIRGDGAIMDGGV